RAEPLALDLETVRRALDDPLAGAQAPEVVLEIPHADEACLLRDVKQRRIGPRHPVEGLEGEGAPLGRRRGSIQQKRLDSGVGEGGGDLRTQGSGPYDGGAFQRAGHRRRTSEQNQGPLSTRGNVGETAPLEVRFVRAAR